MTETSNASRTRPADDPPRVDPSRPDGHSGAWFAPFLAPLLRQRRITIPLGIAGVAQVILACLHLPGIQCPMLRVVGVPCPGCGGSRACAALLRGDWRTSLRMHAMAPFFLLAATLFAAAAVLPPRGRDALIGGIERVERRSALVKLLLILLFVYWAARLVYAPAEFIRLTRG